MLVLILGLILFLGPHSVRIFADGWRSRMIARLGENGWKGLYTLVSIVGLVLIVWGFGLARENPIPLWYPPSWLKHLAFLLNLIAFVLFAAYMVPAGRIKARLGHPMLLSVKAWALAHLLSNGTLAHVVLFGAFLVWAIADFAANRRRDRANGVVRVAGPVRNDVIAVVGGFLVWAAFLWRVHEWLIGVSLLG